VKYYNGCFPSDKLQQPFKYPSALIVNEDPSFLPGTHWVAIYLKNQKEAYYFDSYGRDPIKPIQHFLSYYEKTIKNTKKFQSPLSNTCGLYSIFFIIKMSQGISFNSFIKILNSAHNSDLYVQRYFKRLYVIKE
jgi:hypothetical protein